MKTYPTLRNAWYLARGGKPHTTNLLATPQVSVLESTHLVNKLLLYLDRFNLTNLAAYSMTPKRDVTDSLAMFQMYDWIILSTARSNKHCQSSITKLNKWYNSVYSDTLLVEGKDIFHFDAKRSKKILKKRNKNDLEGMVASRSKMEELAWYLVESKIENVMINICTQQKRDLLDFDNLLLSNEYTNLLSEYASTENDQEEIVDTVSRQDTTENSSVSDKLRRMFEQQRREYSTRRNYSTVLAPPVTSQSIGIAIPPDCLSNLKRVSTDLANAIPKKNDTTNPQDVRSIYKYWCDKFETHWPILLPPNVPMELWEQRLNFLINLTTLTGTYSLKRLGMDFFQYKKVRGFDLHIDELILYLRLVILETKSGKVSTYMGNKLIIEVLQLYPWPIVTKNWSLISQYFLQIFYDDQPDGQIKNFAVFNQFTYPYILDCMEKYPLTKAEFISLSISVLRLLSELQNWKMFLQFWYRIDNIQGHKINVLEKPWLQFLTFINEGKDVRMMLAAITKGHLLPLQEMYGHVTDNAETVSQITCQLDTLFAWGDPRDEFGHIKRFIQQL